MLKEALEFFAGLAKESQKSARTFNEGSTVFVECNGVPISDAPILDFGALEPLNTNTLAGFVAFVNSLTDYYPNVRVDRCGSVLSVNGTGGELGVNNLTASMNLPKTYMFSLLKRQEWRDVDFWIHAFKSTQLNKECDRPQEVVRQLSSMEWTTSTRKAADGIGTSRANYGAETTKIVSTSKEEELSDVSLTLRMLDDDKLFGHAVYSTCYWDFDHSCQKLRLIPYGSYIEDLTATTFNAVDTYLHSHLDGDVVYAGRFRPSPKTNDQAFDPFAAQQPPDAEESEQDDI